MTKKSRPSLAARLQVEALEDRCVLSSSSYVTSLYRTLLHRDAAPGEVAGWVDVLDRTGSPALVANAFVNSPEFRGNLVRFDYEVLLRREAGPTEVASWVNALEAGLKEDQLEALILASNEYYLNHGNTPLSWLGAVYNDTLGQALPANFFTAPLPAFASGAERSFFASAFVESATVHARVVTTDYEQILMRAPDPSGLAFWTSELDAGVNPSQALAGFVTSPEYFAQPGVAGLIPSPPVVPPPGLPQLPPIITPFSFNPILGTSLGGNPLFQDRPLF